MNVDHFGRWNLAPRAHPNDGLVDFVEVADSMSIRDRWAARRRSATGTHVPHPAISMSRGREREWHFDVPHDVWVDGVRVGAASTVRIGVEPDAFTILV
jgi:diacylglycerol kinase family enzyme